MSNRTIEVFSDVDNRTLGGQIVEIQETQYIGHESKRIFTVLIPHTGGDRFMFSSEIDGAKGLTIGDFVQLEVSVTVKMICKGNKEEKS